MKLVEGKAYVNTENRQMTSISAIFTHTRQLNPWQNSSASRVVNYRWMSTCEGQLELFEDHLSTRECLTSLRNNPQQ